MILPIYVYGSAVLREIAEPVDLQRVTKEELQTLLNDMYQTMKKADGVGLAAPQIGKSLRILVVDGADLTEEYPDLKGFKRFMINPEVLAESDTEAEYSEGCLSLPGINANVWRPEKLTVKYLNENLEETAEEFEGFACRMVEHELDHLEGHVFTDHVSPIRRKLLSGKLRNIENGRVSARYKITKG